MKKEIFNIGMAIISKSFPQKHIDIEFCWEMLKDLRDENFIYSIKKIAAKEKEIYQSTNIIALIRESAFIDDIPSVADAWAEVLGKIGSVGSYGHPEFSHEVISRAVRGIGWKSLCLSEKIGVERSNFFKIYSEIKDKTLEFKRLPEELTNDKKCLELISNVTKRLAK